MLTRILAVITLSSVVGAFASEGLLADNLLPDEVIKDVKFSYLKGDFLNEAYVAENGTSVYISRHALLFINKFCDRNSISERYMVHVVPEDIKGIPVAETNISSIIRDGWLNMDFNFDEFGIKQDSNCFASVKLPSWEIKKIYIGQYNTKNGVRSWQFKYKIL